MTIALVRVTPNPDFIDDYLRLVKEATEFVEENYGSEEMFLDGYIDWDFEPYIAEDFIAMRLLYEYAPDECLVDIANEYNCNMQFVFAINDLNLNPTDYFNYLNYDLGGDEESNWLIDSQEGINIACEAISKTREADKWSDGKKWAEACAHIYIPQNINEYYLIYMVAGDYSFSSRFAQNGQFFKDFAEYIKKLAQEQTFLSFDELGEDDWVIYVADTNKFIDWLKTR